MPLPKDHKKEKRDIPDPVEWLRSRSGAANGPENAGQHGHGGAPNQGRSNPMTPGVSGKSEPTKHDGAKIGKGDSWGGGKKEAQGQSTPASKARGHGKTESRLSPNNRKKAGSMTKGKPAYGMPSRNAIARRLHPQMGESKAPSANGHSRSGILSKFEGFTPNRG